MLNFFTKNIPFYNIRHNDLPCYIDEGFGGCTIQKWPVHNFFLEYIQGDKIKAQKQYEEWYTQQLEKYSAVPKSLGGMFNGSLYRLIEKRSQKPFPEVSAETKQQIISERVVQRFALLESIQKCGYDIQRAERIDAVRKKGLVYLLGGHHRAAALLVLGERELPGVVVFPNLFVYKLFQLLRSFKIIIWKNLKIKNSMING